MNKSNVREEGVEELQVDLFQKDMISITKNQAKEMKMWLTERIIFSYNL